MPHCLVQPFDFRLQPLQVELELSFCSQLAVDVAGPDEKRCQRIFGVSENGLKTMSDDFLRRLFGVSENGVGVSENGVGVSENGVRRFSAQRQRVQRLGCIRKPLSVNESVARHHWIERGELFVGRADDGV